MDNRDYKRLTFCLLGVATPNDLIQDNNSSLFNIGKAIKLSGFTLNEALLFSKGLVSHIDNPKAVLQEILFWTGGQPFLTQKLCNLFFSSNIKIKAGQKKTD